MRNSILIVLFGLALNVGFGQKKVLLEKFTHVNCGQCPNASLTIQNYQDADPDLIWVSHYKKVSFDWSPLTNEESTLLWADLAVWGNPTAMFDRTPVDGALINSTSKWAASIDQQHQTSPDVSISFDNVEFDYDTRNITFDVNVSFESASEFDEYRILAFAVEDDVEWRQKSYYNDVAGHPLEGLGEYIQTYQHQNVVRDMIGGRWGSWEGLPDTVEPGITLTQSLTHKINFNYSAYNTRIVVAIAKHHESDMTQRHILNSNEFSMSDYLISSVSDDDVNTQFDFTRYPNPVSNILTLEYEIIPDMIEVRALDGKVFSTTRPTESKTQLNLSHLPAGLYSIQVSLDDQVGVRRLIVE